MAKSNDDAVNILAIDGTDAIANYTLGSTFEDPVTVNLWITAADSINELFGYLEAVTGRYLDDE
jgi:hypothetical protein